jgi:hypothetical protein
MICVDFGWAGVELVWEQETVWAKKMLQNLSCSLQALLARF